MGEHEGASEGRKSDKSLTSAAAGSEESRVARLRRRRRRRRWLSGVATSLPIGWPDRSVLRPALIADPESRKSELGAVKVQERA